MNQGGQFREYVSIQGDWSTQISGLSIESGFSTPIVNVLDTPSGPVTLIASSDTNYDGFSSADLSFTLTGVPLPSSLIMFGTGLLVFPTAQRNMKQG